MRKRTVYNACLFCNEILDKDEGIYDVDDPSYIPSREFMRLPYHFDCYDKNLTNINDLFKIGNNLTNINDLLKLFYYFLNHQQYYWIVTESIMINDYKWNKNKIVKFFKNKKTQQSLYRLESLARNFKNKKEN